MPLPIEISAEMKQRAFDYYIHQPKFLLRDIAAFLDISPPRFRRLRKDWNWPQRPKAQKVSASDIGIAEEASDTSKQHALRDAALSLARITRQRIDALAKEQRKGRATDHDKTARTLASYAKTLTTAQTLLEQEGLRRDDAEHEEKPPRTIHELRDELALHLERIVAEEEAQGSDGLLV